MQEEHFADWSAIVLPILAVGLGTCFTLKSNPPKFLTLPLTVADIEIVTFFKPLGTLTAHPPAER